MPRTALALTALLGCLSPALATLAPRTPLPPVADKPPIPLVAALPQDKPLSDAALQAVYPSQGKPEYRITSRTEVLMDGRPCCYTDVPKSASIIRMEVDSDNHTILTIHFHSKK